ncbi:MAG TPA: paraquat-inducible protein A [Campylobacterales bacterium]|nr:paraquat-inducible protein A [Campylobacterales bacterium]
MQILIGPLKTFKFLFLFIVLCTISYYGYETYTEAKKYETHTREIASIGDANGLASERIDEFTEIISLGLLKNETKERLKKLKNKQDSAKKKAEEYLSYYSILLLILIVFSITCTLRVAALSLSIATLISLIYGLISPILMITIHKEVEYLGDVILSFESKGILGSISKLYENGEFIVALTILLFSVIVPLLKSLTLSLTLLFYQFHAMHKLVSFFKQIGKWSMIDVFVVATLLVYLTSNDNALSHAEIHVGLYFFLIYVLLSMITAILTQKVISR